MSEIIYIGIDNGITGAVAKIYPDGKITLSKMPIKKIFGVEYIDETQLINLLTEDGLGCLVVFEQGQKNPMFGTKGNFSNGYSFGVVNTVLSLGGIPHILINPRTWQGVIFKDIKGRLKNKKNANGITTKEASIEVCRRLYPSISLYPTPRHKKPCDGFADALLMATYAKWEK